MTPEVEEAVKRALVHEIYINTDGQVYKDAKLLADAVMQLEKENGELKREIEELRGRIGEFFNDEGLRIQGSI